METSDAQTLREIAAMLAADGYSLTARVVRDIARRIDERPVVRSRAPRRATLKSR